MIKLFDVATSPSKIRYFNALIDDGVREKNIVCYKTDLHQAFQSAKLKDRPIKITQFTVENDKFRNSLKFKLGNNSHAEISDKNIPFELVEQKLQTVNDFTKLNDLDKLPDEAIINVACHVDLTEDPAEVNTQFGRKQRLNVRIQDDSVTESVKLVLWGNHISKIAAKGSYRFKELRVKTYDGKYLTSTAHTEVTSSDESYVDLADVSGFNDTEDQLVASFPAIGINKLETNYYCPVCNFQLIQTGIYGQCNKCPMEVLLREKFFDVKLMFKIGGENVTLIFPHDLFVNLLERIGADQSDLEDVKQKTLRASNISVKYKRRSRTVTEIC